MEDENTPTKEETKAETEIKYKNLMQKPRIEKVVINIGVGESGEKLVKAEELIKRITERKPVRTTSKHRIPTWNLKKGEPIGCKVTLRGEEAINFLKRGLHAIDNKVKVSSFDDYGNISLGIPEYIDLKGMKYDPDIGMFGMNVNVTMERPGYRIKRRRPKKVKIPSRSIITKAEAKQFMKEKFGVEIEQEE